MKLRRVDLCETVCSFLWAARFGEVDWKSLFVSDFSCRNPSFEPRHKLRIERAGDFFTGRLSEATCRIRSACPWTNT
jgi:hypothetical protein